MLFIYTAHEARFRATFFKYIVALVRAILVQRWICIPSRNCSSLPPCTSQAVQLILSFLPVPRKSPFLPPWCLQQHYPVLQVSHVPPWCLRGCPKLFFPWYLPGALQAVQLILSSLVPPRLSKLMLSCLPGVSQAVQMALFCLPGASLVPLKRSFPASLVPP